MTRAIIDDVLVDLVGHRQRVVAPTQVGDQLQLRAAEDFARRIVRRVDYDRLGARAESGFELGAIDREVGLAQRHVTRRRAGQDHVGAVVLIERLEDDHLVTRIDHREHRRDHRLGGATGHGDVAIRIAFEPIVGARLVGDRAAEVGRTMRDRVLVIVLVDRALGRLLEFRGRGKIGKALRQVDRARGQRSTRHLADDRFGEQACFVRYVGRHRPHSLRAPRYDRQGAADRRKRDRRRQEL